MKRVSITLIALFLATSLFAGGKECEARAKGTAVTLTGTLTRTGSGDEVKTVFHVANSDQTYTVCEQTKASVLEHTTAAGSYRVKGKVVSCGGHEELVISSAQKI